MNIYECLNEITDYIEEHIDEEIDYSVLARKMGTTSYVMQRIFSLLTNITLSEYIRKRRLSCAGIDIYQYHMKVIDAAVKYQYKNATSFSSFHGVKPSMVKIKKQLKNYPKIVFNEKTKNYQEMEYYILNTKQMIFYGLGIKTSTKTIKKDAPCFFVNMQKKYLKQYGRIKYAMTTYDGVSRSNCTGYYILFEHPAPDFEKIIIPKSQWLVFRINNRSIKDIQTMIEKFYQEFHSYTNFKFASYPELEYYHDDVVDFMVPILN